MTLRKRYINTIPISINRPVHSQLALQMAVSKSDLEKVAKDFHENGFACMENFLTPEEVELLRKESSRLIREEALKEGQRNIFNYDSFSKSDYYFASNKKTSFFYEKRAFDENGKLLVPEEQSVHKIAHVIHKTNPVFGAFTDSKKITDLYEAIGYKDPVNVQSMVIFKNPRVGGEYDPHQDASFLQTSEPITMAGIWLALDDATRENGCLEFIPGSHKWPLARRNVRRVKENGEVELVWTKPPLKYDDSQFVVASVKKGALVLIDGLVVHRSGPNLSENSRWIYAIHAYDRARCKYLGWLPIENVDEAENKQQQQAIEEPSK